MKIQELAIIFIIIILPISILLSEYTQFQIKTLNMQTLYDSKLTSATYDAIKAFQLNTKNETYSDLADQKTSDLEASVNAFRNSIMSAFELTGYSQDELNNYIPALVYTLYDGFCIYSPYKNINYRYQTDEDGNIMLDPVTSAPIPTDGNTENIYGIKPYINYSCRYVSGSIDVIITFTLDNFVSVQGSIDGKFVNKSGYLIDNIYVNPVDEDNVSYNGVKIEREALKENIAGTSETVRYFKENGIKYYLKGNQIVCVTNGRLEEQYSIESNPTKYHEYKNKIENNTQAQQYYKDAREFTEWFKSTDLDELTYDDARDMVINEDTENVELRKIWDGNTTKIFQFNSSTDYNKNIENDLSTFNQHRLDVIRHKIETNLAIAISNYNDYSGASNIFQMPELKEDEWEYITNNISLISFLQGLPIGGKIYNGYTLVTNSESEEVVLEENIYILGNDSNYHKIGDKGLEAGGTVSVDCLGYADNSKVSAGRLNLDFNRCMITYNESSYYYYPLKKYNASYDSIVMQNNITTYDDIYTYINSQGNDDLKVAFYTALGRERFSKYNSNSSSNSSISSEIIPVMQYQIKYELNGGDGSIGTELKSYGEQCYISSITPTRSGYIFKGWSGSDGNTYNQGESFIVTQNLTLTAKWEPVIITYTIDYNLNGGSGPMTTQMKTHGVALGLYSDVPTRDGYTFNKWMDSDGDTYNPGDYYTKNKGITLTAIWEADTYTIEYNLNGGDGSIVPQTKTHGVSIGLHANVPTRDGYTFKGWNGTDGKIYNPGETYIKDADITLTAMWEAVSKKYTITFNSNGGSGSPDNQEIEEGQYFTIPQTQPTRTMYNFTNWSGSDGNTYYPGDTFKVTQNITLKAQWKWSFNWGDLFPW